MRKPDWNNTAVLSVIFLAALSARLLKLILDPMLLRDSALYLNLAERWYETGEYTQTITKGLVFPPLPIYTIIKLMHCGFTTEIAGRSICLYLGAMIPVLGYIISDKLFKNKSISGITALLLIFHPGLVSYSIQPIRENHYMFFCGLTILWLINGIKKRKIKEWCLCGVFLSFSLFCRYEALEIMIICPLVLLYLVVLKRMDLKKTIVFFSSFIFASITTAFLLLSITHYDYSFINKISNYSSKAVQQINVRNFIQNDSESNE